MAFGGGCAFYFALKSEPQLWPLLVLAGVAASVWLAARARGLPRVVTLPLMLLMCATLGLAAAKVRTEAVAGPIAPTLDEPTTIEGWVIDVDSPGQNGARVVIAPVSIRGVAPEATPIRMRATVKGDPPPPGTDPAVRHRQSASGSGQPGRL